MNLKFLQIAVFIVVIGMLGAVAACAYYVTAHPRVETPTQVFTDCISTSARSLNGYIQPGIVAECSLLANGK